jgi:hypothetical protein
VWPRFVVAALVFTLTVGALSGAFDLWRLRVTMEGVPVDHQRSHGLAQLFGFLWLFTLGISLHLGPRFFGAELPSQGRVQLLRWLGIGGVVLSVAGRLGALLPGSAVLGPLGAALVVAAMSAWLEVAAFWWLRRTVEPDAMHRFVLAGTAWWWLAGATFFLWQLGQLAGGPLARVPLEAVWAPALLGGGASWLWGVFLRAGLCTLQVRRPGAATQGLLFWTWQYAVTAAVVAAWLGPTPFTPGAHLLLAFAVATAWFSFKPHQSEMRSPQARAVRAGFFFVGLFGLLQGWSSLAVLGAWAPPLLGDATRHCFSLGGMTLLLFGFAGRMVPGFASEALAFPRGYEWGVYALVVAAALRLVELAPVKLGLALAASSGGLAFVGVALVATSLLATLHRASRARAEWLAAFQAAQSASL